MPKVRVSLGADAKVMRRANLSSRHHEEYVNASAFPKT